MLPEEEDFNEYDFFQDAGLEGEQSNDEDDLPPQLKLELKKQARAENKPRKMRNGYY